MARMGYSNLGFKLEDPRRINHLFEEDVPFCGLYDERVDLRRGGFEGSRIVQAGFERAAGG
jgi:hypothetical protein